MTVFSMTHVVECIFSLVSLSSVQILLCTVDRPCESTAETNVQPERFVCQLFRLFLDILVQKPQNTAFSELDGTGSPG